MKVPRVNILGVGVCALTMAQAVNTIISWIDKEEHQYVCVTGVHGVMESQRSERIRGIHNAAGLVTPDGMPLVWLCRLAGYRYVERVYGPDLMLALCEQSQSYGFRHFFYGGAPGVAEALVARLLQYYPKLQIAGTYTPPFRQLTETEDQAIVDMINQTDPHIVWVGLSTPKQEIWMAEHVHKLRANALIGVGAAFDFHSGHKRQAPRWMQHSGLEWLFRLITEPNRLWRRYLINNPLFIWLILGEMLRKRIRTFEQDT
ncbi:MAG: UDP-N-acetyl-D-mannosaminuronic acid transferase [Chloroflexus sp.]|nr:MAG: UDP-N-acetyl-D-mannosaminuronic acid transferase [Chloroflexus sp.]